MGIESFIKDKRRSKDILVMGHVVCGYPSFEENFSALEIMEDCLLYTSDAADES